MTARRHEFAKLTIIKLNDDELAEMKQMIAGASLPLKRTFNEILAL